MTNETAELGLDLKSTALVLIDLQNGVAGLPVQPYSSADIIARAAKLADRCRELEIPIVFVTVDFRADGKDRLLVPTDAPPRPMGPPVPDASSVVPQLKAGPADIRVVKQQWGAFYGTSLDLQLRRRGIDTILLGGIATNMGVESTARDAWERAYKIVFVEDLMASFSAEAHQFGVSFVFPRLGRVRSTEQVLQSLGN